MEGAEGVVDVAMQIKPGLSSYAEDAEAAAKSLEPLLYQALENVPKELQVLSICPNPPPLPPSLLRMDTIYVCYEQAPS